MTPMMRWAVPALLCACGVAWCDPVPAQAQVQAALKLAPRPGQQPGAAKQNLPANLQQANAKPADPGKAQPGNAKPGTVQAVRVSVVKTVTVRVVRERRGDRHREHMDRRNDRREERPRDRDRPRRDDR